MSPPDERSRAADNGPASKTLGSDDAILAERDDKVRAIAYAHRSRMGRRACGHLRTYRPCRACQRQRVDAQDELSRLARAEARALHSGGGMSAAQIEGRHDPVAGAR